MATSSDLSNIPDVHSRLIDLRYACERIPQTSPIPRGFRANAHTRHPRPNPDRTLALQGRHQRADRHLFGSIPARNALLIRIEDQDGAFGWGEVWANFPPSGTESKLRLLETVILPMSLGRIWSSPAAAWIDLTQRMRRNAIQSGEPGPFAACIAGIEVALSDLAARKARLPLWKKLGRSAKPEPVMAYASNLNPKGAPEYVAMCRERGYCAFKLKVAFDMKSDLANVREISAGLKAGERFMIDANQGWDLSTARPAVEAFSQFPLDWIE
jgi:L-alanine-DL-glutamate epimerase-like enolase superfamily enzyme